MKKLMIAAALAACAFGAIADVESSNIVGYTTKDAAQGKFLIIGVGFDSIKGGCAINDVLSGVEGVDYGDGIAFVNTAAQIQVPSALGYTTYYYLNDGWYDDGSAEGATKAGWCDSVGNIVDAEITPGVASWFKSVPSDGSATVSGAVPEESSKAVDCPTGFALRACAFPVAIKLNSAAMTSTDIVGVDYGDGVDFVNTAAQIQVPSALGYTTYYYLNDGWYDDGSAEGATKAGWCDSVGNLVDAEIPAGQGFWTKGTSGAFTLTFTK